MIDQPKFLFVGGPADGSWMAIPTLTTDVCLPVLRASVPACGPEAVEPSITETTAKMARYTPRRLYGQAPGRGHQLYALESMSMDDVLDALIANYRPDER